MSENPAPITEPAAVPTSEPVSVQASVPTAESASVPVSEPTIIQKILNWAHVATPNAPKVIVNNGLVPMEQTQSAFEGVQAPASTTAPAPEPVTAGSAPTTQTPVK